MVESFRTKLERENLSFNTIMAYLYAVNNYLSKYQRVDKESLLLYKAEQMEQFKPNIGKPQFRLKSLKIQQKSYLENVISQADYDFLKTALKEANELMWYFLIRFLGATGARVSELIQFKVEHICIGYLDLYTKGGKVRRLFIPTDLRQEAKRWLDKEGRSSGYLFLGRSGIQITPRSIRHKLQYFAQRWGINPQVMHPHSFRHRYAKNFLESFNDIALLADLMGHESIETTRIYLRRTAGEQQAIVDKVITW